MNRQRLSSTFFAACKVFSNHERYLKYDRVIELTQVQTGQLLDLLKTVHQRIAVYEQLTRGLGYVQVVLEELLNREQRLLIEGVDGILLEHLGQEDLAERRRQLIDEPPDAQVFIVDDGLLRVEHLADLDGDHFITEADRTVIGDPNPDIYGNIFTSVQYRRLRLDVRFNYSLGNDIYNYTRQQLESGSRFMNQTTALARRWQMEGQQTDIPRLTFQDPMGNSRFSDRWIEDGSYLRLKTVTLSYDWPISSTFLQGLQFWIQANNLFTATRYLGSDPEGAALSTVLGQGIDAGSLPQSRNFMVGIKINL